jgi:hypothetical protein
MSSSARPTVNAASVTIRAGVVSLPWRQGLISLWTELRASIMLTRVVTYILLIKNESSWIVPDLTTCCYSRSADNDYTVTHYLDFMVLCSD